MFGLWSMFAPCLVMFNVCIMFDLQDSTIYWQQSREFRPRHVTWGHREVTLFQKEKFTLTTLNKDNLYLSDICARNQYMY
jgi:hypothetical protein